MAFAVFGRFGLGIMLDATGVPAEVTLGESLGKMETG